MSYKRKPISILVSIWPTRQVSFPFTLRNFVTITFFCINTYIHTYKSIHTCMHTYIHSDILHGSAIAPATAKSKKLSGQVEPHRFSKNCNTLTKP